MKGALVSVIQNYLMEKSRQFSLKNAACLSLVTILLYTEFKQ